MTAKTVDFENTLVKNGYRLTSQRRAVLEVILKNNDQHLSTEEICEQVKEKYPSVGIATVYRSVQLLEKLGLIQHISLEDGCLRYQPADPKGQHEHHHLVCEICGDIIDFHEDMLELFEKEIYLKKGFRVSNHRVIVFGICEKCAKACG